MLPQYGDTVPIWVKGVDAREAEVIIDYVLAAPR